MKYYLPGLFLAGLFGLTKHFRFAQTIHPNATQEKIWEICADSLPGEEIRNDFSPIYEEYHVDGMFVLYNSKSKDYTFYNKGLYKQSVPPASTFNILLTLIGLKEGIIKNEKSRLNNDSVHKEATLENAFKNNMDSYFKKLSLLIGEKKIKYWLKKTNYGNKSTGGENGRFWINGSLRITPEQQLNFIEMFYYEKLPFSKNDYTIVKELMHEPEFTGLAIYGKRGSNKLYHENKYIGWYVGYVKTPDKVYFFTNYIECPGLKNDSLVNAQKEIAFKILKALNIK